MLGQILDGCVEGSSYALVALGFTIIFGDFHRLNYAHTEVFTLGGYVGVVAERLSIGAGLALVCACVAGGLAGLAIERISFRGFKGVDAGTTSALSSMAVGQVLLDLLRHAFGADPISLGIGRSWAEGGVMVGGVNFFPIHGVILALAFLLMAAMHVILGYSALGRRIRAVADDPVSASLLGVDVTRTAQAVFFLSSGVAAVGGLLFALRSGSVSADLGGTFGLKALAVAAIGGIGAPRGAVIGGLLVGVLEGIGRHLGMGSLVDVIVWVVMIVVLVAFPQGLFGARAPASEVRA
jgi:branched-chain amino acid transport system permease protein